MEALESKEHLLSHIDLQHRNEATLKKLGLPEGLNLGPTPTQRSLPILAYELTGLTVKPASLSAARHNAIGPWVCNH